LPNFKYFKIFLRNNEEISGLLDHHLQNLVNANACLRRGCIFTICSWNGSLSFTKNHSYCKSILFSLFISTTPSPFTVALNICKWQHIFENNYKPLKRWFCLKNWWFGILKNYLKNFSFRIYTEEFNPPLLNTLT